MKLKAINIVLLFLVINSLFAQNQANIWHFGERLGLDFNSGEPVVIPNQPFKYFNATSTISDENGNMLISCNSDMIFNKNGTIMLYGDEITGSSFSTQGALIVPFTRFRY